MYCHRIRRLQAQTGTREQPMRFIRILHLSRDMILSMLSYFQEIQICKQDYSDFLKFHKEKNAEFSVAVMEVPWEDASRFGLMVADDDDKITEFQEKPKNPKSNLASMGIYIFNWDILKKYLIEDENDPGFRE